MDNKKQFEIYETKRFRNDFKYNFNIVGTLNDKQLLEFYTEVIVNKPYYHGTNSKALKNIQSEGELKPQSANWNIEFKKLKEILLKSGWENPLWEKDAGKVYLATILRIGVSYANRSPESLSQLTGEKNWINRQIEFAEKNLNTALTYGFFRDNHYLVVDANKIIEKNLSNEALAKFSNISLEEFIRAKELFKKIWNDFAETDPILLVFKHGPYLDNANQNTANFERFKEFITKNDNGFLGYVLQQILSEPEIQIDVPISLEYLVDTVVLSKDSKEGIIF